MTNLYVLFESPQIIYVCAIKYNNNKLFYWVFIFTQETKLMYEYA